MKNLLVRICILFCLISCASCLHGQTIRYVKTNGSGNGSSWANASNDLQAMINASSNGDEVWVAEGTYLPTRDETDNLNPTNFRKKTFKMKSGVNVYGGFASTGNPVFAQRNWGNYQTILSGNLGSPTDSTDNALHVVTMLLLNAETKLDGFVIEKGQAVVDSNLVFSQAPSSLDLDNFGGGVWMSNSFGNPVISHCTLYSNFALGGGAIMAISSSPLVTNSLLIGNGFLGLGFVNSGAPANLYSGEAVYNSYSSDPTFINCTFGKHLFLGSGNFDILIFSDDGGNSIIQNSIVWTGQPDVPTGCCNPHIQYTDMLGIYEPTWYYDSTNLTINPQFVDINDPAGPDGKWMTADDGLTLQNNSPCLNHGSNSYVVSGATDIVGNNRIIGLNVEMGAYESFVTCSNKTFTINANICSGDSVAFADSVYYSTTVVFDTIAIPGGCDSIVTLNLTVNEPTSAVVYDTICQGAVYAFGEQSISASGTYNRTIPNSYNCDSVITLHLYVRPSLSISVTQNGFDLSATTGFISYQWLSDGIVIPNANSSNYTASTSGSYSVVVTDEHGCIDTSDALTLTGLASQYTETDIRIRIQPNPTTEKVSIASTEMISEIVIYNMLGEALMDMNPSAKVVDLSLQQWVAGLYQVYIKTSKGVAVRKLVKH